MTGFGNYEHGPLQVRTPSNPREEQEESKGKATKRAA